jgi:hypothetical protein
MNQIDKYVNGQIGGSSSRMSVRFYWDCVIDQEATEQAGRDIYKDVPFILLTSRGGKRQVPKLATPEIIAQYPDEYQEFNERYELTPLIMLDLKPSQIKDLEYHGIKSVEDFSKFPCPAGYERFAAVAKIVNQHREDNEKNQETVRSNRDIREERPKVRGAEVQQAKVDSGRRNTSKESHKKENYQEIQSLNYSFSI